jgi:predicted nucleotidyltransferase
MIEALISSKTRIKLLLKFFLNSGTSSYLRSLAGEFNESTNAIRLELNRMESAGLLSSTIHGNKKIYRANQGHPLFDEIHNIVLKHLGIDQIIEKVIKRLGNVREVYLTGEFARGMDSRIIDLIIVGDVDQTYLIHLIGKAEEMIQRKIRYILMAEEECQNYLNRDRETPALLLWSNEK